MIGNNFVDKCLAAEVQTEPWAHQIVTNSLSKNDFEKLKDQTQKYLNHKTDKLIHIMPNEFAEWHIDFYDEIKDLSRAILENISALTKIYPECRHYPRLGVNCHISIAPPLPWKFYIHQEGLEKIWSSVTYISPEQNIGTKMYTTQEENSFVREAPWVPNSTFIFCGKQGKTWHSYESDQASNRITLNFFVMKYREKKCFYSL